MNEGRRFRQINWNYLNTFLSFDSFTVWTWNLIHLTGKIISYVFHFVNRLLLPFSSVTSIIGFMLLVSILLQVLSGFYLGWYFLPEPGLVIELREEMFNDTQFGYEIFHMHVRGVDNIFLLSYLHILKKIWLKNYINPEADGWILGGYAFFWFHYVVALGICLSASHLSDLTLTIIANIVWSIFDNAFKTYYLIFTNKHLNSDQLLRVMIFHYFTPWYYLYLIQLHVLFCHESWDSDSGENTLEDKSTSYIAWFHDAFLKEVQDAWFWVMISLTHFFFHITEPSMVNFFYFERWNISEYDEIRYYGVAPHWYFRPLMGLLVVAPTHYEGLFWLAFFFILLSFMPVIYGFYNSYENESILMPKKISTFQSFFFLLFLWSLFFVASMLPCGRYYYEIEAGYAGNTVLKWSFQYIYFYLFWLIHNLEYIETLFTYYIEAFTLPANFFYKKYFIKYRRKYLSFYRTRIFWKEFKTKDWLIKNQKLLVYSQTPFSKLTEYAISSAFPVKQEGDYLTKEWCDPIKEYYTVKFYWDKYGKKRRRKKEWLTEDDWSYAFK